MPKAAPRLFFSFLVSVFYASEICCLALWAAGGQKPEGVCMGRALSTCMQTDRQAQMYTGTCGHMHPGEPGAELLFCFLGF